MESVVEHEVITTKRLPKGILDDIFDRLIGKLILWEKEWIKYSGTPNHVYLIKINSK